jgi:hypothetical protein
VVGTDNTSLGGSGGISGTIESPKVKTYNIDVSVRSEYTVRQLAIKCGSGSCTVTLKNNGVAIDGIASIAVTTSLQILNASGNNTLAVGSNLSLQVVSISSATDLDFSIAL